VYDWKKFIIVNSGNEGGFQIISSFPHRSSNKDIIETHTSANNELSPSNRALQFAATFERKRGGRNEEELPGRVEKLAQLNGLPQNSLTPIYIAGTKNGSGGGQRTIREKRESKRVSEKSSRLCRVPGQNRQALSLRGVEGKSRAHISPALARTPNPARVPRPEFPRERKSLRSLSPAATPSKLNSARDIRGIFYRKWLLAIVELKQQKRVAFRDSLVAQFAHSLSLSCQTATVRLYSNSLISLPGLAG